MIRHAHGVEQSQLGVSEKVTVERKEGGKMLFNKIGDMVTKHTVTITHWKEMHPLLSLEIGADQIGILVSLIRIRSENSLFGPKWVFKIEWSILLNRFVRWSRLLLNIGTIWDLIRS